MIRYGWMILTLMLVSMLIGCGGSSTAPQGQTGKLALTIQWPSRSRDLPEQTESVLVEVTNDDFYTSQYNNRPVSGTISTVTVNGIPPGEMKVIITAYPEPNAGGTALARGEGMVTVVADETREVTINLTSEITHVGIDDYNSNLRPGQTATIIATAYDVSGAIVPVAMDGWVYIPLNPDLVSLTPNGHECTVTALSPGTATIRVLERDSGKSWDATFSIEAGTGDHTGTLEIVLINEPILVSIQPASTEIRVNGSRSFTASVEGTENKAVIWSVVESNGGTINSVTGYYSAPSSPGVFHVTATSEANGSSVATATIRVNLGYGTSDYDFLGNLGSYGNGDGQFSAPWGIAIDAQDSIYVTDSELDRVQRFTSGWDFDLKWGSSGTGDGEFNNPRGIALDSEGAVYVVESNNMRIQKFSHDGAFQRIFAYYGSQMLQAPYGIALDRYNNIFITEEAASRVTEFRSDGTPIAAWGDYSVPIYDPFYYYTANLKRPRGIAIGPSGDIYVANTMEHCIRKYDASGNLLLSWGREGIANGEFKRPQGIAVDAAGDVYVTDCDNHRVQKFSANGSFLTKFGSYGTGDGQFNGPAGIAVDSRGIVYVADVGNHRVVLFAKHGDDILDGWTGDITVR